MLRIVPTLALAAAIPVASAASQDETGLRCTSTDRALSERLRSVLPHRGQATAPELNLVMARMASARFDCKHGRVERGLRSYADAETALRSLEETAAAKLATHDTAGGDLTE